MDLTTTMEDPITDELMLLPGSPSGRGRSPLENPALDPIPNDPLCEPHPGEPGVHADGTASPLENPDDRFSADPLRPLA
jgi:hypothetical protein